MAVDELAELIVRLRAADRDFRVFGSKHHKYDLGPVMSEPDLSAFESCHRVRLPTDYRYFLARVGNGGAGPFYGLEPLGTFGYDLSKPFPLTQATERFVSEEGYCPGALELCHQGCGIFSYLVVNGPAYGTIWDGREEFYPTGPTFADWYRRWAERALRTLANENLVSGLRIGMSKADVLAEVGGDWQERQALHRPIRYFEASEIPAQLELDERGVVVKVNPWPFITARPS